jgi:Flp pilus assembly pilin Flp
MKVVEIAKRFVKDERGLETVEYAILLGLIVVATIVLVLQLGGWVAQQFRDVLVGVGEVPSV